MPTTSAVRVHGLPGVWGLPTPSPFVLKLLTWLRMAGIEYEYVPLTGPPRSATKKIPYIDLPDGTTLSDSSRIIAHLSTERAINLDAGLEVLPLAKAHTIRRMLEEHTYFAAVYERFNTAEGWAHVSRDYLAHLPPPVRWVGSRIIRRNVLRNLHGQGMGRQPVEVVRSLARADVRALDTLIEEPYVLGERPATVDATVAAFLWSLDATPFPTAGKLQIEEHPKLQAYLQRMKQEYWSDLALPEGNAAGG